MNAITVHLNAHREPLAPGNPFPEEFPHSRPLLHQLRTYEELRSGRHIVVNSFNTGTGKTRAALLRLRDLAWPGGWQANCLFIAPTNELIHQHADDVRRFVERNALPYRVYEGTANDLDQMQMQYLPSHSQRTTPRRAQKLRELLESPEPKVLVTNPDIFYYALYFCYGKLDQRALFRDFVSSFGYVIIDEFHYYNPKQLANFLFFMSLSKEFGYFDYGRQMCLLSATPAEHVRVYLDRLGLNVAYVRPEDILDQSLESTPAISPVELVVLPLDAEGRGLLYLVEMLRDEIVARVERGEHGAGISGALWRVNGAFEILQATRIRHRVSRLTGAESVQARQQARTADLLLATPTVDIGYNFERLGKDRQSIDFLLFDARSGDEFVQRLGRVGRVLGKPRTDLLSYAWAIVPSPVYDVLKPMDGLRIDRAELNRMVRAAATRSPLTAYISRGAILESFRPLAGLRRMMSSDDEPRLRRLYEGVRAVFAPYSRASFEYAVRYIKTYENLVKLFARMPKTEEGRVKKYIRLYLSEEYPDDRFTDDEIATLVQGALKPSPFRDEFRNWLVHKLERYHVAHARFSFRDSFSPPEALAYDPHHLLSSGDLSHYDVLHIARNFQAEWFENRHAWATRLPDRITLPPRLDKGDQVLLYCIITRMLRPEARIRLRFRLSTRLDRVEWEAQYAYQEAAISGLEIVPEAGQLPPALIEAFKKLYLPMLAVRDDRPIAGRLINLCKEEGWVAHNLDVRFRSGETRTYRVVFGMAMLLAYAELWVACNTELARPQDEEPTWVI